MTFSTENDSQTLKFVVDTGSSVLIVANNGSLAGESYKHPCIGSHVVFKFGAGTMLGNVCNIPPEATLSLGGLTAEPAFMGFKRWIPKHSVITQPIVVSNVSRGILGMA